MTARTSTLAAELSALPEITLFELGPESPPVREPRASAPLPVPVDPVRTREIAAALDLPPELDFDLDDRPAGLACSGDPELALLGTLQPGPPAWAGAVGVFDVETTGIDTATARIVSAAVAVLDDRGVVVERKEWLLDPSVEIPAGATAVHGISTEQAQRFGRPAAEVIAEILDAIRSVERRGFPLVVYNAPYDLTLLAHEAQRHGLEPLDGAGLVVDPLVIDKALDRYRKGKRTLAFAAAVYGVQLDEAHNAGADAIAAGRIAQAMAARYPVELDVEPARLHRMQAEWCAEQAASFTEYMRRTKDPDFTANGNWPTRSVRPV